MSLARQEGRDVKQLFAGQPIARFDHAIIRMTTKIQMAFAEGVRHLGQHRPQAEIIPRQPEADRVEPVKQTARHRDQGGSAMCQIDRRQLRLDEVGQRAAIASTVIEPSQPPEPRSVRSQRQATGLQRVNRQRRVKRAITELPRHITRPRVPDRGVDQRAIPKISHYAATCFGAAHGSGPSGHSIPIDCATRRADSNPSS